VTFLLLVSVSIYRLTVRRNTIDSLAVLPFVNANADPNTEYLSDGLTDGILDSVAKLPNVRVISRTSAFHYKGKDVDPRAVGRELGVQAVLTGTMAQHGDDLSISAELVDTKDNSRIWGDQFNRKLPDILAVQQEISREISEKLLLRLTGEEKGRAIRQRPENPGLRQWKNGESAFTSHCAKCG